MVRRGWAWPAGVALAAAIIVGLTELAWASFPVLAFPAVVLTSALVVAGWYVSLDFLRSRWAPRQRLTGVWVVLAGRPALAIAAIVATLAPRWFSPGGWLAGLAIYLATMVPFVAVGLRLAGRGATRLRTLGRRVSAVAVVLLLPHRLLPIAPGQQDFYFHWPRYRLVVERVAAIELAPGECARFTARSGYLRLERRPDSDLRDVGAARGQTGEVTAYASRAGHLVVKIVTADFHHAGTFGYLYAAERADLDEAGDCVAGGAEVKTRINDDWDAVRWD